MNNVRVEAMGAWSAKTGTTLDIVVSDNPLTGTGKFC